MTKSIDKRTGTLLFIDNDGAFFDVPPLDGLQRNKTLLEGIDKLSRSFVIRVRELDDDGHVSVFIHPPPQHQVRYAPALAERLPHELVLAHDASGGLVQAHDQGVFVFGPLGGLDDHAGVGHARQ